MMASSASAPSSSRLGSARSSLDTMATASGSFLRCGREIYGVDPRPRGQSRQAGGVRLSALGHPGKRGLRDPGLLTYRLPANVAGGHGGAECLVERSEVEIQSAEALPSSLTLARVGREQTVKWRTPRKTDRISARSRHPSTTGSSSASPMASLRTHSLHSGLRRGMTRCALPRSKWK